MDYDKKINIISNSFQKNISCVSNVYTGTESKTIRFCLNLGGKFTSVLINETFIEGSSPKEIEEYFTANNIFELIKNNQKIQSVDNIITIWPNDPACERYSTK